MFEDRWSVVSWPAQYGGRDVGIFEWLIFEEEYYRAGGPRRVSQNGVFSWHRPCSSTPPRPRRPATSHHGRRRRDLVPGVSEPDAGSDLAGIRSRATPNASGDGWVLDGQKTWCSRGAFAEWCFGIFRTDPGAERHRGLTYFLVPMDAPGVTYARFPNSMARPGSPRSSSKASRSQTTRFSDRSAKGGRWLCRPPAANGASACAVRPATAKRPAA